MTITQIDNLIEVLESSQKCIQAQEDFIKLLLEERKKYKNVNVLVIPQYINPFTLI